MFAHSIRTHHFLEPVAVAGGSPRQQHSPQASIVCVPHHMDTSASLTDTQANATASPRSCYSMILQLLELESAPPRSPARGASVLASRCGGVGVLASRCGSAGVLASRCGGAGVLASRCGPPTRVLASSARYRNLRANARRVAVVACDTRRPDFCQRMLSW